MFLTLLWIWPGAMWRHLGAVARDWKMPWLPFAPWAAVTATPLLWEALRGLAALEVAGERVSGLDVVPLQPSVQAWAARVVAHVEDVGEHFTGSGGVLWGAVAVLGVAYIGTGPLHLLRQRGRRRAELDAHGSAEWGTARDALEGGHLAEPGSDRGGLMLGRVDVPAWPNKSRRLDTRYRVHWHVVTCAATRRGKGIGGAIPNLLEYPGSTFALDIKGELYHVTARARMERGFAVARLDPFGLSGKPSHRINWLDGIDPDSDDCVAAAAKLAEALVMRGGTGDSHWDDQAEYLIKGLILHVATLPPDERHMGTVRDLLMRPSQELADRLAKLSKRETRGCGVIAKMANAFMGMADRERSGVLSTAQRHTAFLDDPKIVATLKASDFSLKDLKHRPLSVYVMVPQDALGAYSRFVRATLALSLRAMTQERVHLKHHVLFLIDEFAQLGRVEAVERAIPILHGFGALIWLFIQDLSQLKSVYRNWESFLGNAAWQIFGTQDQGTAEYVSRALGKRTQRLQTTGASDSSGRGRDSHTTSSYENFIGRPLLAPDEVRQSKQVVVIQGAERPMRLTRLNYLTDPESTGLAQANPYYGLASLGSWNPFAP